jgi:hypothetical protein
VDQILALAVLAALLGSALAALPLPESAPPWLAPAVQAALAVRQFLRPDVIVLLAAVAAAVWIAHRYRRREE